MPETEEFLNGRQKELFVKKASRVAGGYLRRLSKMHDTPEEMMPFFDVLKEIYVDFQDIRRKKGQKTIGTYCVMVPPELIYAAGGIPVRLCSGNYTAYSIGDEAVPRDACPLVKAVMGFGHAQVSPLYKNCSLMVIPVTCDCKKKLAGMLGQIKPTVSLHIPSSRDEDAEIEQYTEELYRLIPVLEKTTGNKIHGGTLSDAVWTVAAAQREMSKFLHYMQHRPALLHGTQALAVMNTFSYMSAQDWTRQMYLLNEELQKRLDQKRYVGKEKQPRILVTGSPMIFPNIKVPLLIEEMGGTLAGDETCMGERGLYNPVVVEDKSFRGMMRALAGRYIRPCTCPSFVDNSQRIYRIKQMIKERKVQGVIYHVLRGCLVYDYEYQVFEEELGRLDIPIIRVESDYNEEDVEQLRIRIEAFIEMIKLKDYRKKKGE